LIDLEKKSNRCINKRKTTIRREERQQCGDLDLKSCEILKSLQSKNIFDMKVKKK
jgi:hypothetical protein